MSFTSLREASTSLNILTSSKFIKPRPQIFTYAVTRQWWLYEVWKQTKWSGNHIILFYFMNLKRLPVKIMNQTEELDTT